MADTDAPTQMHPYRKRKGGRDREETERERLPTPAHRADHATALVLPQKLRCNTDRRKAFLERGVRATAFGVPGVSCAIAAKVRGATINLRTMENKMAE